jgi:hypothetical protein
MPRKPTNKRQHTAALNASEPKLNGATAPLAITPLAREIAHLRSFAKQMEEAHFHQKKRLDGDDVPAPKDFPCPAIPFEAHRRSADERASALEKLVLGTEPESLDEALSLTLIALGHLDAAVGDDCSDLADVLDATYALARWLIKAGATTPLDREYYAGTLIKPNAVAVAMAYADELAKVKAAR